MRSFIKWTLILGLVMVVLTGLAGATLLHALLQAPDVSISIDGETLELADLEWAPFGAGLAGLAVAALVTCLVMPLVLLLGVGLPLLCVGFVLALVIASVAGVGALLCSPLLLIALLLWLVIRPRRARSHQVQLGR